MTPEEAREVQERLEALSERLAGKHAAFKRCTKCNRTKPRTQFGSHRGRRDGLDSWCRRCRARRPPAKEGGAMTQDLERRRRAFQEAC